MPSPATPPAASPAASALGIVLTGFVSMGAAMGIGRFAFTPLLPLMQHAQGLTLAQGTWLAMSNYLGYLLGAMWGTWRPMPPGRSARIGLVAVALGTLGMAWTRDLASWLVLRFIAGVASAFVLLGVSGWALAQLGAMKRPRLGGAVFCGVGTGIAVAGLVALVVGTSTGDPVPAWAVLGLASVAIVAATWMPYRRELAPSAAPSERAPPLDRAAWVLVICYGVTGFGYIVPATFLPAVARGLVDDPAVFGWVWPVFGLAAALSVIGVSAFLGRLTPRATCALGIVVMAIGVAAPVLRMSVPMLIVSAVCVGGTFVVTTLAGIQEARRLAPSAPARLVAAMTSAFAFGQLAGPVLTTSGASAVGAMRVPSAIAALALLASAVVLVFAGRTPARAAA